MRLRRSTPYGHIQAVGVDAAGRRQYLYHEQWRRERDEEKFDRMLEVAAQLPSLREQVGADLRHSGLDHGGDDPLIVDADVDPVWAAEQAALGAFANAGQICVSVERIYVHRDVAEQFVSALCEQARRWNLDPQPLVDERLRTQVHAQVREAISAGAKALVGGHIPEGPGTTYPATVLTDCRPAMRVVREETFGPIAPVQVVADFATGLDAACRDDYGLAATVLTDSMEHMQQAWRTLPVGTVKINSVFGGAPGGAAQPRGTSGTGFGYGPELLDEMTTTKVVHMEPAPLRR
ncbi:aldehyde dehydrogenase family protein [Nocardia nova]|uniref:aldehyde dehydrogenase family protein n=1 Tax=Nocardia nova TaxID=37330 RepID=UPI0025B12F69|nr:aldehyde dehydrogenase family protein [Nocardia nova]MDN2498179.1 aldehyde dehydrogenase family protein [Nocardia nova]